MKRLTRREYPTRQQVSPSVAQGLTNLTAVVSGDAVSTILSRDAQCAGVLVRLSSALPGACEKAGALIAELLDENYAANRDFSVTVSLYKSRKTEIHDDKPRLKVSALLGICVGNFPQISGQSTLKTDLLLIARLILAKVGLSDSAVTSNLEAAAQTANDVVSRVTARLKAHGIESTLVNSPEETVAAMREFWPTSGLSSHAPRQERSPFLDVSFSAGFSPSVGNGFLVHTASIDRMFVLQTFAYSERNWTYECPAAAAFGAKDPSLPGFSVASIGVGGPTASHDPTKKVQTICAYQVITSEIVGSRARALLGPQEEILHRGETDSIIAALSNDHQVWAPVVGDYLRVLFALIPGNMRLDMSEHSSYLDRLQMIEEESGKRT